MSGMNRTTTLTMQQFLTLCLIDFRDNLNPTGLHRLIQPWERDACETLLIDLHKQGFIEPTSPGTRNYRLTEKTRQHIRLAHTIDVPPPSLVESNTQPRVTAETHDDERVYEVPEFDCTAWFEEATDDEIQQLIEEDFGGDYMADSVAEFYDGKIDAVTDMFAHKRRGFECHVDEDKAWAWIKVHRPQIYNEYHGDQTIVFRNVAFDQMTEVTP